MFRGSSVPSRTHAIYAGSQPPAPSPIGVYDPIPIDVCAPFSCPQALSVYSPPWLIIIGKSRIINQQVTAASCASITCSIWTDKEKCIPGKEISFLDRTRLRDNWINIRNKSGTFLKGMTRWKARNKEQRVWRLQRQAPHLELTYNVLKLLHMTFQLF